MNPKLLIPIFLPPVLGFLVLSRLLGGSRMPLKKIFIALSSTAAGYALISMGFFLCYVVRASQARVLGAVFAWFLMLPFLIRSLFTADKSARPLSVRASLRPCFFGGFKTSAYNSMLSVLSWMLAALFIYILGHFLWYLAGYMSWNAFGGWDAHFFWFLKARFYFRDPESWRLMFSPYLWWANKDYPLMVPSMMAWGWNLLGREMLVWPMILAAVFVLSLAGLIVWYLASYCSWATALAAGIFFLTTEAYRFWSGTLYCDIPFTFFFYGRGLAPDHSPARKRNPAVCTVRIFCRVRGVDQERRHPVFRLVRPAERMPFDCPSAPGPSPGVACPAGACRRPFTPHNGLRLF